MGKAFDTLTSFQSLHRAAERALRGKRHQTEANRFMRDLEHELFALQDELRSDAYQPGPYRTFWIHDPKKRLISAAPFRDRVVHHAYVAVVEPLFERRFIHHSYACRVGKGAHRALEQFVAWARTSAAALTLDVAKFFPSIDHTILTARLDRVVDDPGVRVLGHVIVAASNPQEAVPRYFPGDDLLTPLGRRVGLPIGNLTSQFFGNVYLDELDHLIKDRLRVKRYLRYVDDLCVFHDDVGLLRELRAAIREALLGLRLRLHERKSRVRRVREGITFLGFVVGLHDLRLAPTALRRSRRRLRALRHAYRARRVSWSLVAASLRAWEAHAAHGRTRALVAAVARAAPFVRAAAAAGAAPRVRVSARRPAVTALTAASRASPGSPPAPPPPSRRADGRGA